jgi:hypothetical protein
MAIPYRDDNRYCWASDEIAWHEAEYVRAAQQVRKHVSVMDMVNELDNELAGDDAQEVWVLDTPFFLDQEAVPSTSSRARSRSASRIITRNGITRCSCTAPTG